MPEFVRLEFPPPALRLGNRRRRARGNRNRRNGEFRRFRMPCNSPRRRTDADIHRLRGNRPPPRRGSLARRRLQFVLRRRSCIPMRRCWMPEFVRLEFPPPASRLGNRRRRARGKYRCFREPFRRDRNRMPGRFRGLPIFRRGRGRNSPNRRTDSEPSWETGNRLRARRGIRFHRRFGFRCIPSGTRNGRRSEPFLRCNPRMRFWRR